MQSLSNVNRRLKGNLNYFPFYVYCLFWSNFLQNFFGASKKRQKLNINFYKRTVQKFMQLLLLRETIVFCKFVLIQTRNHEQLSLKYSMFLLAYELGFCNMGQCILAFSLLTYLFVGEFIIKNIVSLPCKWHVSCSNQCSGTVLFASFKQGKETHCRTQVSANI